MRYSIRQVLRSAFASTIAQSAPIFPFDVATWIDFMFAAEGHTAPPYELKQTAITRGP